MTSNPAQLLFITMLTCGICVYAETQTVTIADPNLRNAISGAVGRSVNSLSPSDCAEIQELILNNNSIFDLS